MSCAGFVATPIVDGWEPGPMRDRYTEHLATVGLDSTDVVAAAVVHVLALPAGVQVVEHAVTATGQ